MSGAWHDRQKNGGFTVLEVLVATVVLSVILAALFQISGSVSQVTSHTRRQLEAAGAARAVLDAIQEDFDRVVRGPQFSVFGGADAEGNGVLFFVTRGRGPAGVAESRCLAVGYQVVRGKMRRYTLPLAWQPQGVWDILNHYQTLPFTTVATGIVRFEMRIFDEFSAFGPFERGRVNSWKYMDPGRGTRQPRSLSVGVAAVDAQSLLLPKVPSIGAVLPTPASNDSFYGAWCKARASAVMADYPKPAVDALEIAQRDYAID